ncbi:cuticle protein 7-like [Ischnura elegans]|uniref:cuticle protein 7-like n=1 Tax=Ischnura elegans TaxID=197161 RepID=UPI001ED88576|nr:cuticle protein 7-like [Ischnura elegans]
MKVLVVLAALVGCSLAGFEYSSVTPYHYGGYYPYYRNFAYNYPYHFGYSAVAPVAVKSVPAVAPVAPVVPLAYTGLKHQYHAQDEFGQASFGHSSIDQTHTTFRDAFGGVVGQYSYVNPEGKVVTTSYTADAVHGFRVASNDLPVAPAVPETPALVAPEPVQDTPEVVAARAEHLAAHAEVKSRSRRQAILPITPYAFSHATPYAYPYAYPYHAPLVRKGTLTTVVNTPGHAVSYRVD